jgi:hypothetical protein
MILKKLEEALSELANQRRALDDVEAQLRSMISKLSDGSPSTVSYTTIRVPPNNSTSRRGERDRIDDILDIVRAEGHPMHINAIVTALSQKTGSEISRTQLEPGLNRHVKTAKTKRIDKFGPSVFGLPEWRTKPTTLAHAS